MRPFMDYATEALEVKVPESYARFMQRYGKKLSDDPFHRASWVAGLGNEDFVVGTTLAFRSEIPNFSKDSLVIGYLGTKTVVINRAYEELDVFVILNAKDGKIYSVDSLGAVQQVGECFEDWIGLKLLRAELQEKYTSTLTVVVFDDELKAEEARVSLLKLEREGFVDVEDVVVVVKRADGGTHLHSMHRQAEKGGAVGSITGLVVGTLLLHPLLGALFGAVTGALSASLSDTGIEESFVQDLSEKFKPGSSGLFALVRHSNSEKVEKEFHGFGGKVLVTSMPQENEAALQAVLDGAQIIQP